jgi:hypothetical protein
MSVMSADEREDFLKRENELSDQLAEKVSCVECSLFQADKIGNGFGCTREDHGGYEG